MRSCMQPAVSPACLQNAPTATAHDDRDSGAQASGSLDSQPAAFELKHLRAGDAGTVRWR